MKGRDLRPLVRLALTRAELALSIGVSTTSIDKMVEEGALPPARLWHTKKLWIISEVEASLLDLPVDGDEGEDGLGSWDDPIETKKPIRSTASIEAGTAYTPSKSFQLMYSGWRDLPNEPLDWRELKSLKELASYPHNSRIGSRQVKISDRTRECLRIRGLIGDTYDPEKPKQAYVYWLTEDGWREAGKG